MEKNIQINLTLDLQSGELKPAQKLPVSGLLGEALPHKEGQPALARANGAKKMHPRFTPLDKDKILFRDHIPEPAVKPSAPIQKSGAPHKTYAERADQFTRLLAGSALALLLIIDISFHIKTEFKQKIVDYFKSGNGGLVDVSASHSESVNLQPIHSFDDAALLWQKIQSIKAQEKPQGVKTDAEADSSRKLNTESLKQINEFWTTRSEINTASKNP